MSEPVLKKPKFECLMEAENEEVSNEQEETLTECTTEEVERLRNCLTHDRSQLEDSHLQPKRSRRRNSISTANDLPRDIVKNTKHEKGSSHNQESFPPHNKIDEQAANQQITFNQPNSYTHDMNMEHIRQSNFQAFNNQMPNMSTVRTPNEMLGGFPSNWHPGSSFQFLRPPGVLPFNLYMAPPNSSQMITPALDHNVSYFQELSQLQSFDSQHSQQSSKKNLTGGFKSKEHWTTDEDVELCVAWVRVSEDSVIGTGQRQTAYWTRVTDKFHQLMKDKVQKDSSRSKDALISRWATIHRAVTRWSAIHATLTRNSDSGWTTEELESRVRAMYRVKHKELFKFEECWKILRDTDKWKTWVRDRNEDIQTVTEPMAQQETLNVAPESEVPLTPGTEAQISACPPSQLETDKEKTPHLSGPTSNDVPIPNVVKKAKNQRQRLKQRFSEQQNMVSDSILAALTSVDVKGEERSRRQEELKRQREEVLDQRFEEQKQLTLKEHEFTMESKKMEMLKDLEYIYDRLVLVYRDLETMNQSSSSMTPRERFEYEIKREWAEMLEAQREGKRRKLRLAKSPVHSSETCPSASRASR